LIVDAVFETGFFFVFVNSFNFFERSNFILITVNNGSGAGESFRHLNTNFC